LQLTFTTTCIKL